jgi:Bacterial surface proteins containing Ig-like domains
MKNQTDIMYKQLIRLDGTDGKVNDTECRFLICEENDSGENKYDLKYIITDKPLKQGDYITFNDTLHMVIDTEKTVNSMYTKGVFREVLKITFQTTQKDVYAVVDKVKGVYAQGQQITEVHDQYNFIIPKSSCKYTSISTQNNLIIYAGGSYDAISIDDSKEGILIITGRFSEIYNPHVYTVTLNSNSQSLQETASYQLTAIATDNNVTVSNPTLIWSSSDPTIASVDSTGKVTALLVGSCVISCNFMNVTASCNLMITAKPVTPVISYSGTWSNTTTLKLASSSTYTATQTTNGVDTSSNINLIYAFDSVGASLLSQGKITITKKTNASCTIKNANVTTATSIYVTFTDSTTGTKILDNQLISLRGV